MRTKQPNHSQLLGQGSVLNELEHFISDFKKQKKNAILLHGPTGCGKTAAVHALANKFNYDVIELSAADFRSKKDIEIIIGGTAQQQALFSRGKLILIDELEGFSGTKDRGGLPQLSRLLNDLEWPIILITNKPFDKKFSTIRRKAQLIEFKKLDAEIIIKILQRICADKKISADSAALKKIALASQGDARAAINDLRIAAIAAGKRKISEKDIIADLRNQENSIFNALRLIFKSSIANSALGAFDGVNMNMDECLLWLDENLPLEYSTEDLAAAYDALSKADRFRGRILRQQHWRFLVYIAALATAGISAAKSKVKGGFTRYKPTSRLLKLWIAKTRYAEKKEKATQLAAIMHCSQKKALAELPYLELALK